MLPSGDLLLVVDNGPVEIVSFPLSIFTILLSLAYNLQFIWFILVNIT